MYAAALPPPPLPQADQGSVNSRQQTTTKIAAEVIEVLHENSLLEMTSVLQGHIYSGRHPRNMMLSRALIKKFEKI